VQAIILHTTLFSNCPFIFPCHKNYYDLQNSLYQSGTVPLSVCRSVCPVHLSLPVRPSVYLSVGLFVCLFVSAFDPPSSCLSLSVCVSYCRDPVALDAAAQRTRTIFITEAVIVIVAIVAAIIGCTIGFATPALENGGSPAWNCTELEGPIYEGECNGTNVDPAAQGTTTPPTMTTTIPTTTTIAGGAGDSTWSTAEENDLTTDWMTSTS
jgi:hypothetical protein